uniref:E3 ubiquitin-protein ligase RNF181 n=1 Tax=Pipistrellus kuhlii TaxID=59472 RepID=A0A7J7VVN5_PIPKU|nr:ring finger protein 181 [Pipistrellus kuhlii]
MASYFDEHDCEPLDPEGDARTNILLEIARWVRGAGRSLFNSVDFGNLGLVDWDDHLPPPAAKTAVESLPRTVIRGSRPELKCPVCLLEFEEEETAIEMPCHHLFHSNCILPWLKNTAGFFPPRQIPARSAAMNCPLMMILMKSTNRIRLASSRRSTDWRACMKPCTHEAAGATHWSSTSSSCTSDPH